MRLLLFNLATDTDDPILGFTAGWVRALADRAEVVHVITMREGRHDLPGNVSVHSVGKENGFSEPRRAAEFYRILTRLLRDDRVDVCFSHMMPLFTVMAAPLLKYRRIPIVTWYAHPRLTLTLQVAHHCSDRLVSAIADSYPYRKDKLAVIGHGIDTDEFTPAGGSAVQEGMILCVGRLSPAKDHRTLIDAASLLRQTRTGAFRVVLVGGTAVSRDREYLRSLRERVKQLKLEDAIAFEPPVRRRELPSWYRRCTVHVNLAANGSIDKVALEAMACGRPSLVANEGFRETMGKYADSLVFRHGDATDLAEKLSRVLRLRSRERDQLGRYLCARVLRLHSLDRLAQRLIDILTAVKQERGQDLALHPHTGETR